MKRLTFTALMAFLAVFNVSAQLKEITQAEVNAAYEKIKNLKTAVKPARAQSPSAAGRNIFNSFILDYDSVDRAFGLANAGNGFQHKSFFWQLNKNYSNDSLLDFRNVLQRYDSLLDVDNNRFFPRATSIVRVDSIVIPIRIVNRSAQNDTFIISVLRSDSIGIVGTGPAEDLFTPRITWSDTFVLNQSLDLNGGFFPLIVRPNVKYPVGRSFAVRLDFMGPASDHLRFIGNYNTSCNDTFSNPSVIPFNTLAYTNLNLGGANNFSGVGPLEFNRPTPCRFLLMQTAFILPFVTVETVCHTLSFTSTPATCGQTNGGATVNVNTQNYAPYTYAWSGSASTTNSISGVAAGKYRVTVTGTGGCTTVDSVTITNTGGPTVTSNTPTNINCFGQATGSATVVATGTGLTYTWSTNPAQTTATASNLTAGQYTVTVKDGQNCITTSTVTITQPTAVAGSVLKVTDVNCKGAATGKAKATGSGGTGPYTYKWSTTPQQTTDSLLNVGAGNYTVTITDSKGCTVTAGVSITEPATAVTATIVNQTNPTTGQNNGTATVSAAGGTSPYTYSWSGSASTGASVNNLGAGPQSVTVRDSKGCTATANFTLTAGPNAIADIAAFNKVSVYPNPASTILNIKADLKSNEALTVEMIDVTGKVVIRTEEAAADNHLVSLNVNGIAKGAYTVALTTKSGVARQQVIVE